MILIGICGPTTALDKWLYVSRGIVPGNVMALEETMSEWQPIETAPKDGRLVDLWVQPCEDAPDEYKFDHPARRAADCYYHDYTWYGARWPMEPTHWMPLPAPPASTQDEQQ